MSVSSARTLKGPRRLVRRAIRRAHKPALAVPPRLPEESGDGRIGHPVVANPDRQDACAGRLGGDQAVRRIWPGVGTFTRPILEKLGPDATLLTIDTNPEFTDYLKRDIDDPRLVAVTGSAAEVERILEERGFAHADYVLSGLPFSTLPPGVGAEIGAATSRVIRPGGAFLVYQFSPKVLGFIKPVFERIERGFEWINVPPATLFWAYREPS